jgi:ribonucleoside-diphosphate reductase alpha chain
MSHTIAPFTNPFAHRVYKSKYAHDNEEWGDTTSRVVGNVMGALPISMPDAQARLYDLISQRKFLPGGRYLYASGLPLHQVNNCLLMRAEDSREGWADLSYKCEMALMTGAGIGVVYSDLREAGAPIRKTRGVSSGPLAKMNIINELGRNVMQGGNRRSAIWAGLHWNHADVLDFIRIKDWPDEVRALKEKDFTFPARMDMTNISVILDDEFFLAYYNELHPLHHHAHKVYLSVCDKMLSTGEPGFSIDVGENSGENCRNACCEVTSYDDSDVCNLGSINIAAFSTKEQFASAVRDGTLFLLAGTVYSDVPYQKVADVRNRNRRLGLGLMGIHEFLLKRGGRYEPTDELAEWLSEYERATEYAIDWSDKLGLSHPVKTRAIAPTGTLSIIGETTSGIEPMFAAAYKRRVRNANPTSDSIHFEYVIDPVAKRLIENGVKADQIEDAYELSYDLERRFQMQTFVQKYVDMGISNTVNTPGPVHDLNEIRDFSKTLIKYLPGMRGVTLYPNGSRHGQPLTPVPVEYAMDNPGVQIEQAENECLSGVCSI